MPCSGEIRSSEVAGIKPGAANVRILEVCIAERTVVKAGIGKNGIHEHRLVEIDVAYAAADKLGMDCVGFDFVVDKGSGEGKIVEMCYGFDYEVQRDLNAYVDRNHVWHEESVFVPDEIIKMVVRKVENKA